MLSQEGAGTGGKGKKVQFNLPQDTKRGLMSASASEGGAAEEAVEGASSEMDAEVELPGARPMRRVNSFIRPIRI